MTETTKSERAQEAADEVAEAFEDAADWHEQESMRLQIHVLGPVNSERLRQAANAGQQQDYDEYWVLPKAEFPPSGLVDLRTYVAERVHGDSEARPIIGEVVDKLRRHVLAAVTVDGSVPRWVDPARWMKRDAGEIIRTGVLDGADVYLVVDREAAELSAPPWERTEWDPAESDPLRAWCFRKEVLKEAHRRIQAQGTQNPSAKAHYRELEAMWREARQRGRGNPLVGGKAKTIEQVFQGSGHNVIDCVRRARAS